MQGQTRVQAEIRDPSVRAAVCVLRAHEPEPARADDAPAPVAEVLSDGTVRGLSGAGSGSLGAWESGTFVGDGWMLWWERRRFSDR
jgi:hypothetical protein